jgi:S-adenosylmethionine:tRNA ribosyltransferase-isomerase
MFAKLHALGVSRAELTLHVGIGTFRPVKVERVQDHVMHEERYEISEAAAQSIQADARSAADVLLLWAAPPCAPWNRSLVIMARSWQPSGRTGIFHLSPPTPSAPWT